MLELEPSPIAAVDAPSFIPREHECTKVRRPHPAPPVERRDCRAAAQLQDFLRSPDPAASPAQRAAQHHAVLGPVIVGGLVPGVLDGTSLNFTRRGQTQGLGTIGSNQTGAQARGLHLHTTLAVSTEGLPLGVLRARFDAPTAPRPRGQGHQGARGEEVVSLD